MMLVDDSDQVQKLQAPFLRSISVAQWLSAEDGRLLRLYLEP